MGFHAIEALINARYFVFMQVYFHKARVACDEHLREFLRSWLAGGNFPIALTGHQRLTDNEVTAEIARDGLDQVSDGFFHANATRSRLHFLQLFVGREYSTDESTRIQAIDELESGTEPLRPGCLRCCQHGLPLRPIHARCIQPSMSTKC